MLQSWQNNDKIKRCEINKSNVTMLNKTVKKLEEKNLDLTINMLEGENKILIKVYLWIVLRQLK
jgi:hypothetical protein